MSQQAFIESDASRCGARSVQYLSSRHPNRKILVLRGKGNRSVVSQFELRLEV